MRHFINLLEQFLIERIDLDQFLDKARGVMELVRRGATDGERTAAKHAFERLMARAKAEAASSQSGEMDRFLSKLQQIATNTEAPRPGKSSSRPYQEPPRAPKPKFRVGQWVMADGNVGKIAEVYRMSRDGGFYHEYRVQFLDHGKEDFAEHKLQLATQDEVDAAQTRYVVEFKDGTFVVHLDDNKVGKVTSTGWDRETMSRFYDVDFMDGTHDLIEGKRLRAAREDEVEAAQTNTKQTKPPSGDLNIVAIAAYVSEAENSNKVYGIVERGDKTYTFWGGRHKALAVKEFPDPAEAHRQYDSKVRKGYREMPNDDFRAIRGWVITALTARFAKL